MNNGHNHNRETINYRKVERAITEWKYYIAKQEHNANKKSAKKQS